MADKTIEGGRRDDFRKAIFQGDVEEVFAKGVIDQQAIELKNYVDEQTGETVMTRLVKQFNETCRYNLDERDGAESNGHRNKAKKQANLLIELKHGFGYSDKKKDTNGDSPRRLLQENIRWHSDTLFVRNKASFEEPATKIGKKLDSFYQAAQSRKGKKTAIWLGAAIVYCFALGYGFRNQNNTDKAKKDIAGAVVDSTHTSADHVVDVFTASVQGDEWNINSSADDKIREFQSYCEENGIRVQPYYEDDGVYLSYDGQGDRVLRLNSAYLLFNDNAEEMITDAVEMIKIDAGLVHTRPTL